jgi:cytochrome c oxidase subunit 3
MNDIAFFKLKRTRSKKMMLWFGMISICMTFGGLTSAYVVSSSRADWINQIQLPTSFTISTILILLSSLTFIVSKKMLYKNNLAFTMFFLTLTLVLSLAFTYFQFQGFERIIDMGYYFTGPQSSITTSYLYVLVILHLAHLFSGIIVVLIVLINTKTGKYTNGDFLGFELAENFWHFLDLLWIYLFLFVSFYH